MRQRDALFGRYRDWTAAMVEAGEPLGTIELELERAPLRTSSRDALWLLAWAMGARPSANAPAPARQVK